MSIETCFPFYEEDFPLKIIPIANTNISSESMSPATRPGTHEITLSNSQHKSDKVNFLAQPQSVDIGTTQKL